MARKAKSAARSSQGAKKRRSKPGRAERPLRVDDDSSPDLLHAGPDSAARESSAASLPETTAELLPETTADPAVSARSGGPSSESSDSDETWIARPDDHTRRITPFDRARHGASLVVISHPDRMMLGSSFSISPNATMTIGRSSDAEVGFPEVMEVSRRHARIRRGEEATIIEDLGSRNGTWINGARLDGPRRLISGDIIEVQVVKLKFIEGDDLEQGYHEALYHLTVMDDLTGIFNRRRYDAEVERDFARSRRHHTPLSLIVFDVDDFKTINDDHGHPAGDAVLQQIARLVESHVRREEVFARAGGDEFLILCPDVPLSGASVLAEKLRALIAQHPFRFADQTFAVTCSFGVASLTAEMNASEELYVHADRLLYRSKDEGRNRVSSAD